MFYCQNVNIGLHFSLTKGLNAYNDRKTKKKIFIGFFLNKIFLKK